MDLTALEPPVVEAVTDQSGYIMGTAEKYSDIEIKIGSKVYKADTFNEGAFHVAIPVQKAGTLIEVFAKDEAGNISQAAKMTKEVFHASIVPAVTFSRHARFHLIFFN